MRSVLIFGASLVFLASLADTARPASPTTTSGLEPLPPEATPAAVVRDAAHGGITLDIPDRGQAADAPPHGFCGEAAIQQALLFTGRWLSQPAIHDAGHTTREDLHAGDLEPTLERLGVEVGAPPTAHDLGAFLRWIRAELEAEHPVLAGLKLYPTEHPGWAVDHFVLVVGADDQGLTLNTTWKEQRRLTWAELSSMTSPLTFENPLHVYFALSVRGPVEAEPAAGRAHLIVTGESPAGVEAVVVCEGLTIGHPWALRRAVGGTSELLATFVATGPARAFRVTLAPTTGAELSCTAR